jgi:hypothetical protein
MASEADAVISKSHGGGPWSVNTDYTSVYRVNDWAGAGESRKHSEKRVIELFV